MPQTIRENLAYVQRTWPFEVDRPLDADEWTFCLHCEEYELLGEWQIDPDDGLIMHGRDGCDGSALDCFMRDALPQLEPRYGKPAESRSRSA
jgi:hypothetical protein